jgi:transposase InsO family protein
MNGVGFGGKKKVAEILLRCSWEISPRSVGRILKEKPIALPPEPQTLTPGPRLTTVRGDYPNHLWLVDITRIPTLFPMLWLHPVVVLDAFSRLPLAATIRLGEPAAAVGIDLLDRAIRTHGRPRHLVTDQGAQFTAPVFRAFVKSLRIRMRHGKVGETHSLGLIDRFFRTLKDSLSLRSIRPWNLRDFKHRLTAALIHYAYLRPHTSLGGFTPIETYYGIRRHLPHPVSPPRGRVGDPESDIPFDFVFLDPENRAFPVLVDKAA